jgi:hypothetical protein
MRAELTLSISYDDSTASREAIQAQLEYAGRQLAECGILVGDTNLTVTQWDADVTIFPIKIKRFLRAGELDEKTTDSEALLQQAGRALDAAYSTEIFGEVLFESEDGVFYAMTVEADIGKANPDYAAAACW